MGQMAPLPCGLPLVWVRLRETTLTENLECSPIGSKVLCSTLFWQLLQSTWFQTYWYYHSSGSHQLDREGDSVFWATQSLHRCAQASTLERTLQLCFDIGPTQGMTVTGYKPKLNWHVAGCQGSFLMVGEVIQPHWTANTCLKLSSPQPIRCCPTTGHLPHWVHGDQDISNKWTVTAAPSNYKRSTKKPALRFGCWNVCTMMTGLSTDLQTISDVWKTAIINNELLCLQIDIAALQETRLAESGCLRESDYTFFWQGRKKEDVYEHGVGFAVRNMLLNKVQLGSSATEHLLSLQLNTTDGPVNLLCVYAPTLMAPDDTKDDFYSQLDTIIKGFPKQEDLVILGDFNARIGSDNEAWPNCLGHFGVGKCNDNGQ